ncbi:hypothetical protein ACSBR1_002141 [Camellia fascicularis]
MMADPAGDGSGICTSSESVEEKNKEAVDDHQFESSSCSPSSDNKIDNHSFSKKPRLFGRQKSVHVVLGGGKSADIILWRNKQISAGMLASATVIWLLFEWIEYHLLTFVCHSLIFSLAMLFLFSNLSSFANNSPLKFPEFEMPEDLLVRIALLLRDQLNLAIATFREVALGKDLKKFLYITVGLWVTSVVSSWFDFLTLLYIMFVLLQTIPFLYEMQEDQVDTYAEKAMVEIKKQYAVLDGKVIQKIPKLPFMKDDKHD